MPNKYSPDELIPDDGILAALCRTPTPESWSRLVSFAPTVPSTASSDANRRARSLALLSLHQTHRTRNPSSDHTLSAYLLDEETRFHKVSNDYRSSLSLAAYNLCRFRCPGDLWPIWFARECTNYDASVCVDTEMAWYAAGGMEEVRGFVEGCGVEEVVGGAGKGSARAQAWLEHLEEWGEEEEQGALAAMKKQVIDRLERNQKTSLTDEAVVRFVEASWRATNTAEWASSLLPEFWLSDSPEAPTIE